MRAGLYPKLAWDGIRKNKRFYLPYILTCIGMVMMFYIIHYLAAMPTLKDMPGGRTMETVLGFGFWIVALFAVIFLFYSNSFLMRRRQKEFGLYNKLGMGKGHLSIVLFWENLVLFVISMAGGLLSGILLSKIQYLYATIGVGIFCALYFSISKVNQWICISIFVGMLVALLLRKRPLILYSCAIIILLTASLVINKKNEEYVSTAYYEELYQDEIENLMQYAEDDWYRTNVSHLEKHLGNRVFENKFYGTSVYSSTSNSKYQEFYETYMGNNERYRNCFITSGAQNEVFYTFMGTRYIIAEKDPGFLYEKVAEETNLSLYKNTSAYPLVYKSRQCINEAYFDKLELNKIAVRWPVKAVA